VGVKNWPGKLTGKARVRMNLSNNSSRKPKIFIFAGVLIGVIVAAFFILTPKTEAAPPQPIAFPHQVMVQLGVDCLFCHETARTGPAAGMPSVAKCMGCHNVVDPTNPVIQQVAVYWKNQQPIPWQRVNQLPRFVFFNHSVHVNSGVNCEACHGDVGHMAIAQPVVKMDMGWCLSCHEKQPNAPQLMDCDVCHR
jgi:hypothetical protein